MTALSSTHPAVLATLLDSFADQLPCPKAPKWERDAERGMTASSWKTCPRCNGEGTTNTAKRRNAVCPTCQGEKGWRTDAYDVKSGRVVADSHGTAEMSLSQFYDTAQTVADHSGSLGVERIERLYERTGWVPCLRCMGEEYVRGGPCPACHGDRGQEQRIDATLADRARGLHPCFAQLEQALAVMRHNQFRYHWAVLIRRHLLGLPTHDEDDGELYDDALHMLGITLDLVCAPRGFVAPRWARDAAENALKAQRMRKATTRWGNGTDKAERDREIHRHAAARMGARAIGRKLGISHQTVMRVLDQTKEAA